MEGSSLNVWVCRLNIWQSFEVSAWSLGLDVRVLG